MLKITYNKSKLTISELKDNFDTILDIIQGRGQIKPLKNMLFQNEPLWEARLNDKDRLIFAKYKMGKDTIFYFFTITPHKHEQVGRQANTSNAHVENLSFEQLMFEGFNLSSEDIDTLKTLNFQGLVNYGDSTLTLSDAQEAIVERRSLESKDSNLIVLGPPGSGKTSTLYCAVQKTIHQERGLSLDESKPILFMTSSAPLRDHNKVFYERDAQIIPPAYSVEFATWEDILMHYFPNRQLANRKTFSDWLVTNKGWEKDEAALVHYDLSLLESLGDRYYNLSIRQCYYKRDLNKQKQLIPLLKAWKNYLGNTHIDPMIQKLPAEVTKVYSKIYCDETQNLPPAALNALLQLSFGQYLVACLDIEQCLLSSPYIYSCLKELLFQHKISAEETILFNTWRCPVEVVDVANHIADKKHSMDKNEGRRLYHNMKSNSPEKMGGVSYIDGSCLSKLKSDYVSLPKTAILVGERTEKIVAQIRAKLGNEVQILTADEAIGREFDTVILWRPFKYIKGLMGLHNKKTENLSWNEIVAFNTLYVSITRTEQQAFIYEEPEPGERPLNWRPLAQSLFGDTVKNNYMLPANSASSSFEARNAIWMNAVTKHLQSEQLDLALHIMQHNLKMTPEAIEQHLSKSTKQVSRSSSSSPEMEPKKQLPQPSNNEKWYAPITKTMSPAQKAALIKDIKQVLKHPENALEKILKRPDAKLMLSYPYKNSTLLLELLDYYLHEFNVETFFKDFFHAFFKSLKENEATAGLKDIFDADFFNHRIASAPVLYWFIMSATGRSYWGAVSKDNTELMKNIAADTLFACRPEDNCSVFKLCSIADPSTLLLLFKNNSKFLDKMPSSNLFVPYKLFGTAGVAFFLLTLSKDGIELLELILSKHSAWINQVTPQMLFTPDEKVGSPFYNICALNDNSLPLLKRLFSNKALLSALEFEHLYPAAPSQALVSLPVFYRLAVSESNSPFLLWILTERKWAHKLTLDKLTVLFGTDHTQGVSLLFALSVHRNGRDVIRYLMSETNYFADLFPKDLYNRSGSEHFLENASFFQNLCITEDGVEILEHLFKINSKISPMDVGNLCELGNDESKKSKISPLIFLLQHQKGIDFLKQRIAQDPCLSRRIFDEMTRLQPNNTSIFLLLSESESGLDICQKLLSNFDEINALFKNKCQSIPFSEEIESNFKKYSKEDLFISKEAGPSPLTQRGFYALKESVHEGNKPSSLVQSLTK